MYQINFQAHKHATFSSYATIALCFSFSAAIVCWVVYSYDALNYCLCNEVVTIHVYVHISYHTLYISLPSPSSDVPQTPKSKVTHILTTIPTDPSLVSPRFNLRPLASYYTLSCLSLSLSLLWFLLLPLWLLLFLLLLALLLAGVWGCTRRPHGKTL